MVDTHFFNGGPGEDTVDDRRIDAGFLEDMP